MQSYRSNGETVDATRYEPGHPSRILHHLAEIGVACAHVDPINEAVRIFSHGEVITISDPRHEFDGAEGIIYPGDWILCQTAYEIKITPSRVFASRHIEPT